MSLVASEHREVDMTGGCFVARCRNHEPDRSVGFHGLERRLVRQMEVEAVDIDIDEQNSSGHSFAHLPSDPWCLVDWTRVE